MSLPDTVFIFALALIIFGPKKLPEIGRQLGKLVLEFRRASNEFKMQIEEELRTADEADRQRKLAAQNSASATPPAVTSETLTIQPPSTGTMESAERPFKPYYEQENSPQPEVTEPDVAKSGTLEAEAPEPEVLAAEVSERQESLMVSDSQETLGDYERVAGSQERTAGSQERTAGGHEDLEEQTAHHHG